MCSELTKRWVLFCRWIGSNIKKPLGVFHMLSGFSGLIKHSSSPDIEQLQAFLQENSLELAACPSIDGSLKRVYALPGSFALACFRGKGTAKSFSSGKVLLEREKSLLSYLQDLGLPTVGTHGEPFAINDQYALLMTWIDDANFIDVKDQESAARKLISAILGISIPAGEGWVLRKQLIEKDISDTITSADFSLTRVILRAVKLRLQLQHICEILDRSGHLINDLQLLVNQYGVYIIDPMDVVKRTPKVYNSNMCDYRSVIDGSTQEHPDFIKMLYDGKRMLQQCVDYCQMLAKADSKEACRKLILSLIEPKETISPRGTSLHRTLLQKQINVMPQVFSSTVASSRKKEPAKPTLPLKRIIPTAQSSTSTSPVSIRKKSPKHSPESSPHSSPEKNVHSGKENEQVGSPESPTKELCTHFRMASLKVKRCLFPSENASAETTMESLPSSSVNMPSNGPQ